VVFVSLIGIYYVQWCSAFMSHGDVTKSYGMHIAAVNEMIMTCEDELGRMRLLGHEFRWEQIHTPGVKQEDKLNECWIRAIKLNFFYSLR
jgi:hypothetical protein